MSTWLRIIQWNVDLIQNYSVKCRLFQNCSVKCQLDSELFSEMSTWFRFIQWNVDLIQNYSGNVNLIQNYSVKCRLWFRIIQWNVDLIQNYSVKCQFDSELFSQMATLFSVDSELCSNCILNYSEKNHISLNNSKASWQFTKQFWIKLTVH